MPRGVLFPRRRGDISLESDAEALPDDDRLVPAEQLTTPDTIVPPLIVQVPVESTTPPVTSAPPRGAAPQSPPAPPAVAPAEPAPPVTPPVEPVDPPVEPVDPVDPVVPVVGPEWTYGIVEDIAWNDLIEPRPDIELFADAFAVTGTTVEFVVGGVVQLTKVVDESGRVAFWHVMYLDEVKGNTPVTLRYLIDGQPGPETSHTIAEMRGEVGSGVVP